jgi:hypothetical protein
MIEHVFLYSSKIALSVSASSNDGVLIGVTDDESDKHIHYITLCYLNICLQILDILQRYIKNLLKENNHSYNIYSILNNKIPLNRLRYHNIA